MTNNLDSSGVSAGDRAISRSYLREFWSGMIAYFVILAAVLLWGQLDGDSPWRFVWALLPVLPALWLVVALLRHIRRIDDYQRQLLLQGLAAGFALAMLASVTFGFLAIAGLEVPGMAWIIYSIGMLGWLVASQVVKYR
ncbi:hypothetical protein GCM10027022_01310 [Alpinimonas psychrophila]|uniref:Uncharacterized protein n=1 Tax=Alpinimonas psychrophila TaxID=748908 RepID=A0A7W3PN26_9MICO|nr:hypothetical protein [Alpinimonas psychrophila]MBA8827940.1 hypothetical protein [Alpinimonas psychrophila]